MIRKLFPFIAAISFIAFLIPPSTYAFHPLITDDAGTQGRGKFQLEINGQYGHDKDHGVVQNTTPAVTALTYGVIDTVDVSVGVPYTFLEVKDTAGTFRHDGFGDVGVSVKWRFYEHEGLSLALKPGLTFPTGNEGKQLGTGRVTYSLFFIATKEAKPWAFHFNAGYIGNENKRDQRVPLWHVSAASEVEVVKRLKLAVNTGIQRNVEKGSATDPAFLLGGVVYSITDNIDLDVGYKYGLAKPEVNHTGLAGITIKF